MTPPRPRPLLFLALPLVLQGLLSWPLPAAAADSQQCATPAATESQAPGSILLPQDQVRALGIESVPLPDAPAVVAGHPGTVVVPTAQQRVIAAPLAGLLQALPVAVGDSVHAGQTVAILHSSQANDMQRHLLQTRSQDDLSRRDLERDERLFKEGLIGRDRLEASRATHRQARMNSTERRSLLVNSNARIDPKGSGKIVLTSPIAGVVLEAPGTLGQRIEQATPIVRIGDLATLWLELQVPAMLADDLHPGDVVRIAGRDVAGRIVRLGQSVDPATQTVLARAEIRAPDAARVRPGLAVDTLIEQSAGLIQIAVAAMVQHTNAPAVFVEQEVGRYQLTPVTVRATSGSTAAVSGLVPGSKVVVRGTAALLSLLRP